MILKIHHIDYNSWWFFDNLEKIRLDINSNVMVCKPTVFSNEHGLEGVSIHYDGQEIDPEVIIVDTDLINPKNNWSNLNYVISRDSRDNEKCIVFNTNGFLLNDSGKTIERIPRIKDLS